MTAIKATTALVVLAVLMALLSGTALARGAAQPAAAPGGVRQYTAADIDRALADGPVFLEFETKECGYCRQQRPISEALADEYRGKVTFFFVDVAEDRALARQFQVSGVPQIDVIRDRSDGYTYVGKDGVPSDSVAASRFMGLTQGDTLRAALDAAVRMRGL